ncbi:amino acid adenylation domain-containing protein [Actinomadura sp. ATCC 31491]|uniref:Amino acid adenylation domain-containing protein n=1 Tax=Actinomadura luzonensis TaxID=2805427 RepID=A0ABT0FSY0_9ACTN|nr:amino acid adenylation domain-containing protein [Actinomadura luzonensis]MCK2215440.1 amino acid adenylation domain-containing protein [Actinomadura luzonensis]
MAGAGGPLTYGRLNARANRLARHLERRGAGPGRVVAVCLERTVETYVVLLAVLKTGAAYLPLDPAFPEERLRFLLADADAVLTIASPALRDRLPSGATPVLSVGEPDLSGEPDTDPPLAAGPEDLAYLISTSGSTGTPKAVAIPHRALSRLVAGAPGYLDVGPGTTFLQAGPLTFDVAVLEWTPLAHGGRVVVDDLGPLLGRLREVLREHRVSTLKLVSPQLDLLLDLPAQSPAQSPEQSPEQSPGQPPDDLAADLAGLRTLVVGGDVVNPKSFETARRLLPGCRVIASYGPTECTVLATVFQDWYWSGRVPIGHAIPYTRAYVLDRDLNPASVGMRGEIYLAGDGLARGYHGRPGLTAAAFVPDPAGPPGARMYRTGDVGRRLASGAIDFLGRADRQLKIRGYRVEASEVEHALLAEPGVSAAVVVRAELPTGPALVAYVVAGHPAEPAALRRSLAGRLPAYLVPDHVVPIPRLPLTANNKVDRAALPPVPVNAPRNGPGSGPAAVSGLEARVAEAWSAVLGRDVPVDGDFFDHGGHSLLVPRATAAVRRLLGREVPLGLMLRHRTPTGYARVLLDESSADLGAATREHRLERREWHGPGPAGGRRVDLFVSAGAAPARTLVVLDGSEFVDVMRLPALLDRLALDGDAPPVAAAFLSPRDWAGRRGELLADAYVDVLADELLPYLREWLGERAAPGRATVVGASLGAVTAIRAALRRPDRFAGAVALSGPLTEHRLGPAAPARRPGRFLLAAGREEADLLLDDGLSLVDATKRTGEDLTAQGHVVRCSYGDGGHTYAAWEAALPAAITWALSDLPA